jgi:hypothetical protein
MEGLLGLLFRLLVFVLIAAIAFWIVREIPLERPWKQILSVIVALILLIVLVTQILPMASVAPIG